MNISFIIPAFNCEAFITEAVDSIINGNFQSGDEIVICNDASTDDTKKTVFQLIDAHKGNIKYVEHHYNRGPGVTRNTAIQQTKHSLIFCLDSDNVLVPNSVNRLKDFLLESDLDSAAFQEVHYFKKMANPKHVTHRWIYNEGLINLEDHFARIQPGASGNYLYTKKSWINAGGYPQVNTKDTWGFGFRQSATGSKIGILNNTFYYHRYGINSNWVRESKKLEHSLIALQILLPYLNKIDKKSVNKIFSRKHRLSWFGKAMKNKLSITVNDKKGKSGKEIYEDDYKNRQIIAKNNNIN